MYKNINIFIYKFDQTLDAETKITPKLHPLTDRGTTSLYQTFSPLRPCKLQLRMCHSFFLSWVQTSMINIVSIQCDIWALFRSHQNSKFFYSFSITLIFRHMYGALNVDKKNN